MRGSLCRRARPTNAWWNIAKTLAEVVLFWFVFIITLPIAISVVEVELAIQRFPGFPLVASVGVGLFALLGIWAALTLAVEGRGTPLPLDETRRLVVVGPYAFVRNPLMISAAGQGVAIGLAFGSVPVLLSVFAAATWWQFYWRPKEEQHLAKRFGARWAAYARHVRAIRPRLTPYREQ